MKSGSRAQQAQLKEKETKRRLKKTEKTRIRIVILILRRSTTAGGADVVQILKHLYQRPVRDPN